MFYMYRLTLEILRFHPYTPFSFFLYSPFDAKKYILKQTDDVDLGFQEENEPDPIPSPVVKKPKGEKEKEKENKSELWSQFELGSPEPGFILFSYF